MSLPIVHLTGSPYDQGVTHGKELQDRITDNLRIYFDRFEREVGLTRGEVLARASRYAGAIEGQNPHYFAGMRGVTDGAGFDLVEIAALNVRYEILYFQFGKNAIAQAEREVDGCTTFAVLPEASKNGHLLLGQNWDWIPQVRGAVLHTVEPNGMETLAFTEAGIVGGKIGMNTAGVALAVNGMTTMEDDWSRLAKPFHVRCYEILRSEDFEAAVGVITGENRSCTTNFLVGQAPDRVADIEAAPTKYRRLSAESGCLTHTNHFVDPDAAGVVEAPNERRPYSCHRLERMRALLDSRRPVSVADLETYLRDHEDYPFGICRHENPPDPPAQQYTTVTAVIMDLHERTLRLTDGPSCQAPYQTFRLA